MKWDERTKRAARLLTEAKRQAAALEGAALSTIGDADPRALERRLRLHRATVKARERVDRRAWQLGALDQATVTVLPPIGPARPSPGLLAAAAALEANWDALCRCVDEFEPEYPYACAEHREHLDTAILRVIDALHGREV